MIEDIKKIIHFGQEVTPTLDFPKPERLLAGHPRRLTWEHYLNASATFSAGVWSCEPGKWRIQFAPEKTEFFCVLAGEVCLHQADGSKVVVRAGEAAVIPPGFCGVFEVVQSVKKYYVLAVQAHDAL